MQLPILCLALIALLISLFATAGVKRLAIRVGFVDRPGHRKIHIAPKPLGGGIAIYLAIALPLLVALIALNLIDVSPATGNGPLAQAQRAISLHLAGIRRQSLMAGGLLFAMTCIHLLGIWDDRKTMGPYVKLAAQVLAAGVVVIGFNMRALTVLGPVASSALSILWIVGITNALNFLDNMDGLSAGVGAVATTAFLVTALLIQQWFVAAMLALLLGALLGFLWHNFNPASIFMGDSGSLLVGFVLGVLTVRTTYLPPGVKLAAGWYDVLAPIIVMAVPLYDLIVVCIIRLRAGRSPFVGDTNHLSHRLVARGMSRRTAVLCIYLMTAATSIAAILLPHVTSPLAAALILIQVLLVLALVALLEQHPLPAPATDRQADEHV